MFDIIVKNKKVDVNGDLVLPCEIILGDYSESLNIPVSYWKIDDYRRSWKLSIEDGMTNKNHSALIVSMYEPEHLNFIFAWIIYFDNNLAHVQNSIIFTDEHVNFDVSKINQFIRSRELYNEDGIKISEWDVSLADIMDFYHKLCQVT